MVVNLHLFTLKLYAIQPRRSVFRIKVPFDYVSCVSDDLNGSLTRGRRFSFTEDGGRIDPNGKVVQLVSISKEKLATIYC